MMPTVAFVGMRGISIVRNLLWEVALPPINLGMSIIKEIRAKWLVGMAAYLSNNPQFIVNSFLHSGITGTFNGDDKTNLTIN